MRAPITFRLARPEDGPQLLSLHRRAILTDGAAAYPLEAALSWAHGLNAAGYARSMQKGEDIEVAVLEGRIIGFCGVKAGEIAGLYVDPEFTRRGIGARLANRALQRIRDGGHASVRVTAALSALPFYAAMGFEPRSERLRPTRGGVPIRVLEMERL